jgi:hypothetical protein
MVKQVSEEAKDLIRRILVGDPEKRLGIEAIQVSNRHPLLSLKYTLNVPCNVHSECVFRGCTMNVHWPVADAHWG